MSKDPVCGMNVSPETSNWVSEHNGIDHYFCSEGCLKAFNSNPGMYLDRGTNLRQSHQHSSMGGCCGGGGRRMGGWMRYFYIGFMLLYLASIFLR
jgi:YHS domain-containing protein